MITQERLKELFEYDPEIGLFTRLIKAGQRGPVGSIVGVPDKDGYLVVQIGGTKYKLHRLAWFYMKGVWPIEIDHRDGVPDNNVWTNLREATRSDNVANSNRETGESGLRGVKYDPNTTSWRARIAYGYQRKWLGPFDTAEEAHAAYLAAAEIHHGEFALHNRNP